MGIAWNTYRKATGRELPRGSFTIRYPQISFPWDIDDTAQLRAHLPRLDQLLE